MNNKDRLDFLYNKREELHKQMDTILMEISLLPWEDKAPEELVEQYKIAEKEYNIINEEITIRGGIILWLEILYIIHLIQLSKEILLVNI